jgi:REP element-mobilizing transposase RayT
MQRDHTDRFTIRGMVKFDPQVHRRRSIRLPHYDYAQPGAYFVTMVAWHRECLFGTVVKGEMQLNKIGKIVEWEWLDLSKRFSYIELGAYAVMPNHFHGILFLHENVGATRRGQTAKGSGVASPPIMTTSSTDGSPLPHGPKAASLGAIVGQFKSRATKRIWKFPEFKETPIWQRNYYEHIIRNDTDLHNKTDYIEANPLLWEQDEENRAG